MLFIPCTTQYFWVVDTIYTMHYVVFLGGGFYIYYALRSIFGGRMLYILCTTHHFRVVDTRYTIQYAVFLDGGFYINYALRSIFQGPDAI